MILRHTKLADFRKTLREVKPDVSYSKLGKAFGVNPYYFWRMMKDPRYRPPGEIMDRLYIQHHRDWYAMPVAALRAAIEGRKE